LSRQRPQGEVWRSHPCRSPACGFVAERAPQAVDAPLVHRPLSRLSTGGPQAAVHGPQLLHTAVHCSATKRPASPRRVKAVTPRWSVGLWGSWVKLGTALGRSRPVLCIGCAELSRVHRQGWLSTGPAHRRGGQKTGCDLRGWRYPPFPQALLLLPLRVTGKSASKRGLCTTRPRSLRCLLSRLDPEPHRLSAACVRLVPAVDERASNSRRRFR
jgi:hypothetical protein